MVPKSIPSRKNSLAFLRKALAGLVVFLFALPHAALGQTLAVFPTGVNVAITQPTAVPLTWIVKDPESGSARSPQGLFRANSECTGEIFGTVSTPLTATVSKGVGLVAETLVIPQDVTNRTQARGIARFFYCRDFSLPSGPTLTANVTFRPGGSAFASFSIARIDLLFQNQRSEITTPLDTPDLQVFADIRYNGTGVLKGQWEILEPGLLGSEGFRVLDRFERFIPFGDRVVIQRPQVPPLPTNIPGGYVVRLRVLDPALAVSLPTARYFVETREHITRISPIRLVEPVAAALPPVKEIQFRWQGITGAAQYRLEVVEAEPVPAPGVESRIAEGSPTQTGPTAPRQSQIIAELSKPGTTVLLALTPPKITTYRTRPDQLQKFRPGLSYAWRVQALDDKGQIIGESALSRFTFSGVQ
jgi:hypothetical protein